MLELYLLMAYVGVFCLFPLVGSYILMIIHFSVYKQKKGKLNFWQFAKRWKI